MIRWRGETVGLEVGMHGCSSGSTLLVNAEVDSMGGVVDGGVGIGLKTSPRRAAIEKAQAELRSGVPLYVYLFQFLLLVCFPSFIKYDEIC